MKVLSLDHLVLTVASIDETVRFYERALGMTKVVFGSEQRVALRFGDQKINLHQSGREFEPKATSPAPGSADLCFIVDDFNGIKGQLDKAGVAILVDESPRTGANGPIRSIYIRDPDGNLIELSEYAT